MSAHDLVTCALVYLAIGSLVWVALYSGGLIQEACAHLRRPRAVVVMLSIAVFAGWPVLGFVFAAGMMQGRARR